MFFQPSIPNFSLKDLTRKRRLNEDLTQNLPSMDLSVPSDLPQPNQPVIPTVPQGRSKLDILANILNAVASGVAVAQSDNPGQTLMQQITQRRQEAMQRQNQQFEAQQRERDYQFKKEQQQSEYGQRTKEQATEINAKKELQQEGFKNNISLNSQEFAARKDLQESDQKAREALVRLEAGFQLHRDSQNQAFQMDLQKSRDAGDIKQVQIKTVMAALLSANKYHSPAPIEQVMNIVGKIQNDQALDKSDTEIINHAIKTNAATASGGSGIGGKIGLQNLKAQQRSDLELLKDESKIVQSMVEHSTVIQKDLAGNITVIKTPPDVLAQQIRDTINLHREIVGIRSTNQNGKDVINLTNAPSPEIQQGELQVVNNVKNFLDGGGDPNSINMSALPPNLKAQVQNLINAKKKKFGATFGR